MNRNQAAMTIVELIVVITILCMLAGIMLPAVQGFRETGRRSSCQSHLAQLGVALSGWETAHGCLPPGTTEPKGPIRNVPRGNHVGWIVSLLPHLDEGSTHRQIDAVAGVYDPKNAPVRRTRIARLVCPSELDAAGAALPTSSYAGCHHDIEAPIDADNHGVLFLGSHVTLLEVTDGLTHTIFLGEKRSRPDDLGWMSGTASTLRNTGTAINAALPAAGNEATVGGVGSAHPGGANLLFGDGAVRFVAQQIATDILQQLGHRADGKLLTSGPTREQ